MSTKVFILVLFLIFVTFLIYEDTLFYRHQCCEQDEEERYQDRREELENNDSLSYGKTAKEIESIVDIIRSPFYNPSSLDINTSLTNSQKIYGTKDKKAQIGNLKKDDVKTMRDIHQPLLRYYDTVNWFERDSDHDFDMFLK